MDPSNPGEKKYGLIIPSKNKGGLRSTFLSSSASESRSKVFTAADSSSDENLEEDDEAEDLKMPLDWKSRTVAKANEKSMQRNQARAAAMKALEEDPTVFQYDEVYDDMQQKKEDKKPPKEEKKPKYIENLLRTAELRKVELERRTERKVQKERETEGDQFNDKESFVTPAYRAKLAELKKLEEEERIRELREASLDVTKQSDMSGFYRHLYKQTFDEPVKKTTVVAAEEVVAPPELLPATFSKKEAPAGSRHYRGRRQEEEEEEEEPPTTSHSEDDEEEEKEPSSKPSMADSKRPAASAALISAAASDRAAAVDRAAAQLIKPEPAEEASSSSASSSEDEEEEKNEKKKPEVKEKIDIWKKRTTGQLFEDAVMRYQNRKEAREQGLVLWP